MEQRELARRAAPSGSLAEDPAAEAEGDVKDEPSQSEDGPTQRGSSPERSGGGSEDGEAHDDQETEGQDRDVNQKKRASQAARRLKLVRPVAPMMGRQGAADAEAVAAAAQYMMTAQVCGEAAAVEAEAAVKTAKGEAAVEIEMAAAAEAAAGLAAGLVQGACPTWKVETKVTFQGPVAEATA